MSVTVRFTRVDVPPPEYDCYWGHLTVFWPDEEGNEGLAFVEVRLPKTLHSLDEIKMHALNRMKEFFQEVLAAEYSD